jgi:hypothetical protein
LKKLRSQTIEKLKLQNLSETEIRTQTEQLLFNEYTNYVHAKILSNKTLETLSPGIGKLISNHIKTILIIRDICKQFRNELDDHLKKFESELRQKHRIKSLISDWINEAVLNEKVILNK